MPKEHTRGKIGTARMIIIHPHFLSLNVSFMEYSEIQCPASIKTNVFCCPRISGCKEKGFSPVVGLVIITATWVYHDLIVLLVLVCYNFL